MPPGEAMMIHPVQRNRNEVTTRGRPSPSPPRTRRCGPTYTAACGVVFPDCDRFLAPILLTLPARLVVYHLSVARGIDPDSLCARDLSKTLTLD